MNDLTMEQRIAEGSNFIVLTHQMGMGKRSLVLDALPKGELTVVASRTLHGLWGRELQERGFGGKVYTPEYARRHPAELGRRLAETEGRLLVEHPRGVKTVGVLADIAKQATQVIVFALPDRANPWDSFSGAAKVIGTDFPDRDNLTDFLTTYCTTVKKPSKTSGF